jgi:hypothetical protein
VDSFRIDAALRLSKYIAGRNSTFASIDIPAAQNLDGSDISMDDGELNLCAQPVATLSEINIARARCEASTAAPKA